MDELVSIVVPVYNVENYLHRCIQSILAQTYSNFELILVDDGSKDTSGLICDEYAKQDKRITVFHNENMGANSSRKFGVSVAKGTWIMFVDSDDIVTANCIELLYKHHDKADVIVGTLQLNGKRFFNHQVSGILNKQQYIEALLLNKTSVGPVAKLYKKQIFDFSIWVDNSNITNNEDLMMLIFVASRSNSVFIDNAALCYNYLFREGSATSRKPPLSMWLLLFSIIESTIKPLFNNQTPTFFYLYCLHRLYDCVVLNGIPIDYKSSKEINHILSQCKNKQLTQHDYFLTIVISSHFLQKCCYWKNSIRVRLGRIKRAIVH